MANENLKNALQAAGLTVEEFAQIIQVDPKTVGRWVAGTTIPYPRHRATITRALDLTEADLWPDLAAPASATENETSADGASTPVPDGARVWARTTDPSAPSLRDLLTSSDGSIDILDDGTGLPLDQPVLDQVMNQADAGHHIRLLTNGLPSRVPPRLIGHPHVEVRAAPGRPSHSLLNTGQHLLLTFSPTGEWVEPAIVIHTTPAIDDALCDRLISNFEALWDSCATWIVTPQNVLSYLNVIDPDDKPADPTADASPAEETEPRHWPRHPT